MNSTTLEVIFEFICRNKLGFTISQLKEEAGLSRETITKYVEILYATGKIKVRFVGNARVYYV